MHIPQDELQKFQDGTMNTDEMIHFLEHMEQCDFCLDELLQNEDAAPSYLQDEILKKAASPEVQASRKIHETAYWMKLLCAGLRTAVGMGVALIMLFSWLGSFGGTNEIPHPWDTVLVAVMSLAIYYWGARSCLPQANFSGDEEE